MQQKRQIAYTLILTLTMLLGIFLRIHAAGNTIVDAPLRADAGQYYSYAYNMRFHDTYSRESWKKTNNNDFNPTADALRSPGYPLFLWIFTEKSPTQKGISNIVIAQSILGIFSLLLVFAIAQTLLPGAWPLLPTLLTAISPQLVNTEVYILSESLFGFLLLSAIYTCTQYKVESRNSATLVIAGLLLGLATIVRPTTQYFLPFFVVYAALASQKQLKWHHYLAIASAFILPTAFWTLRNIVTLGIYSDPTLTINTLVHGHYPSMMYNGDLATLGYPYRFDPKIQELSASVHSALAEIWNRIQENPTLYLQWYLLEKPITFLSWSDASAWQGFFTYPVLRSPYLTSEFFIFSYTAMKNTHWTWVILASISVIYFIFHFTKNPIPPNSTPLLLTFIFIYFLLIHTIGFPIARYNTPILPVIFLLASLILKNIFLTNYKQPSNVFFQQK
ncbi:glycosyltransferase family 39 protein [Comamonas sp. J-3]|uniref:glycosyltransferase family 39 protein n=1 Tax=Comamonas trifloxystrobinivorans TaxID=3350256 RepID=UPI00372738CD